MIVLKNEVTFNELERKIYEYGCEVARQLMEQVLKAMDEHLFKERDTKVYRDKGKRKTSIKTLMGEVEYSRRVYQCDNENGTGGKKYIYLLDQVLGVEKVGLFSGNLVQLIIEEVVNKSVRKSADSISNTTGQRISHGGVWNIVQAVGENLKTIEKEQAKAVEQECSQGQRERAILFEEADGVHLSIQGKDRKKGKRQELKVAISYEGWKEVSKGCYEVVNKLVCAGFEPAAEFKKRKEGMLGAEYNLDEIQMRILNGDGGNWIKNQGQGEEVHYQLDPFHKSQAIIRNIQDKQVRATMLTFLKENKYEEILMYVSALEKDSTDEKTKEKLRNLYKYFSENSQGLMPYLERGLELPVLEEGLIYRNMGTMEHNVCDVISQRMKHRKGSWSIAGGGNMAKVLAWKTSRRLKGVISQFTSCQITGKLAEAIQAPLSAAQVPKTIGSGYSYPTKGSWPFEGVFKTNGRNVIQMLVSDRVL
ncbi:MAG: ISLre2 family transposase [Methanosarcina sp.]|nr:ISLre2 family transposase [Methanosarcina sp.]